MKMVSLRWKLKRVYELTKTNATIPFFILYISLRVFSEEFELNNEYIAFSGIGNHKTFISMIKEFGVKVIKDIEFPDHYYYRTEDINKILEISKKLNCKIITTEKDYLRLDEKKIDEIKFVKSDLRIINENKLIEAILN